MRYFDSYVSAIEVGGVRYRNTETKLPVGVADREKEDRERRRERRMERGKKRGQER